MTYIFFSLLILISSYGQFLLAFWIRNAFDCKLVRVLVICWRLVIFVCHAESDASIYDYDILIHLVWWFLGAFFINFPLYLRRDWCSWCALFQTQNLIHIFDVWMFIWKTVLNGRSLFFLVQPAWNWWIDNLSYFRLFAWHKVNSTISHTMNRLRYVWRTVICMPLRDVKNNCVK